MWIIIPILLTILIHPSASLQCVDHNNNPVDWYVLYKIPYMKSANASRFVRSGFAYTFITSNSVNPWKLSSIPIASLNSILALTLLPLYSSNATDLIYILYNDQPPNKRPNDNKGHTKGVVVGDEDGGFWLIHSVPNFPSKPEDGSYIYPLTGSLYGQSFLCISLNSDNLNNIGKQLLYNELNMYAKNMPSVLSDKFPHLTDVINGKTVDQPPWFNVLNITSRQGTDFTTFAKTKNFGRDLYRDWVTPTLGSSFFVETWPNGVGRLPSSCGTPFSTLNVKSIKLSTADVNIDFSSTHDHSKWAVSSDGPQYWICVGDINRADSQMHRGGGTVCMINKLVATSYKQDVNTTETCS
ncbi:Deoxyribonuclease II [Popillia japonica]|uniref:Deoxyribonuclease II n=1 Tax=Popillia japonica TaxID=7064 RepID=A0AAW1N5K5_POPJA